MYMVFNQEEIVPDAPGALLLSHGAFAVESLRSAKMIVGPMENVIAIGFDERDTMEDFSGTIAKAVEALPDGSVVLVDCLGGTPFNQVMRLLMGGQKKLPVVAGFNLPMLIELSALLPGTSGTELAEQLTQCGKDGVIDIEKRMAQT